MIRHIFKPTWDVIGVDFLCGKSSDKDNEGSSADLQNVDCLPCILSMMRSNYSLAMARSVEILNSRIDFLNSEIDRLKKNAE